MKRHLALLGAMMMLCGTGYQAQATPAPQVTANAATSIVTGRVVDEQGEPIIGASIVEVGTTRGTSTDVDGNFSIRVSHKAKLQVSFLGYKTETVGATNGMRVVLAVAQGTDATDAHRGIAVDVTAGVDDAQSGHCALQCA